MVHFSNNGLDLWYATDDAPAPVDGLQPRKGLSMMIGVKPAHPSNSVKVQFRVDGGGVQTAPARRTSDVSCDGAQYFVADFPTLWSGDQVEYLPILSCAGRRVPDLTTAATFPSSFRLDGLELSKRSSPVAPLAPRSGPAVFTPRLSHMVHVSVPLTREPEIIGQTPEGFIVNWPPVGGTLDGPAFRAIVIPGGEHQAVIRTDGMAILRSSVTIKTDDHALIEMRHMGTVDYGRNWQHWLQAGNWPAKLPVRKEIRLLTAATRYEWLNRLLCLGIGEVRPADAFYSYDMYSVE